MNRPRNVLLLDTDPREPVVVEFCHSIGALRSRLNIHQTPDDETWPGGALWDCGVLLSQLLLAVAGIETLTMIHTPLALVEENGKNTNNSHKSKQSNKQNKKSASKTATHTTTQLATRLQTYLGQHPTTAQVWHSVVEEILLHRSNNMKVLELGCGVGLTGLVASIALGASVTILTDLTEVVERVTIPNVDENSQPHGTGGSKKGTKGKSANNTASGTPNSNTIVPNYRMIPHFKGGGKVLATPLCWGNREEAMLVLEAFQALQSTASATTSHAKGGGKGVKKKKSHGTINNNGASASTPNNNYDNNDNLSNTAATTTNMPDIILLGDVAYQHKPGAPSHFDILVETLHEFLPPTAKPSTLLLFGTRLRMPASMDLLALFQEHFTPILPEPIPAHVLEPSLAGVKHNMTLHIFTNPKPLQPPHVQ